MNTKTVPKSDRKMYRQGDVLLIAVPELPERLIEIERDPARGIVLAKSEVTGHAHRISSRTASLYRSESEARFMRVMGPAPVALQHEEHTAVELPPGSYQVVIHHEYQPGEIVRRVED